MQHLSQCVQWGQKRGKGCTPMGGRGSCSDPFCGEAAGPHYICVFVARHSPTQPASHTHTPTASHPPTEPPSTSQSRVNTSTWGVVGIDSDPKVAPAADLDQEQVHTLRSGGSGGKKGAKVALLWGEEGRAATLFVERLQALITSVFL